MIVFICYTPLHTLIAQEIINNKSINDYVFIYFYDIASKKNSYYFDQLASNSLHSLSIFRKKHILWDFTSIYKAYRSIKHINQKTEITIYTANIKSIHTRMLMFLLKYSHLYTFDDGCANIANSGFYYKDNENIFFKAFFAVLNPALIYKELRHSMHKHYSIFKEKNIYPNQEYISIFHPRKNNIVKSSNSSICILLTGGLSESNILDLSSEKILYSQAIDYFNITHVIPHPSENTKKVLENIKYIQSDLIAEDIIMNLNETNDITIVGRYSTVLLNISGLNLAKRLIAIDFPHSHITEDTTELFLAREIECYKKTSDTFIKITKKTTNK